MTKNELCMLEKVATSTIIPEHAGWWLMTDGNVWYFNYTRKGNEGPLDQFIERVKAGQLRAKLLDKFGG